MIFNAHDASVGVLTGWSVTEALIVGECAGTWVWMGLLDCMNINHRLQSIFFQEIDGSKLRWNLNYSSYLFHPRSLSELFIAPTLH